MSDKNAFKDRLIYMPYSEAKGLIKVLIIEGGFTWDFINKEFVSSGFAVGIRNRALKMPAIKSFDDVSSYQVDQVLLWAAQNIKESGTPYIGAWHDHDHDEFVFDAISLYTTDSWAKKEAASNKQDFYYDLNVNQVMRTYPHPITKLF